MLKNGGNLLTEIEDILIKFPEIKKENIREGFVSKKEQSIYEKIVKFLSDGSKTKDEIEYKFKNKDITELLFLMEIEGIIKNEIGKGYSLKKKG